MKQKVFNFYTNEQWIIVNVHVVEMVTCTILLVINFSKNSLNAGWKNWQLLNIVLLHLLGMHHSFQRETGTESSTGANHCWEIQSGRDVQGIITTAEHAWGLFGPYVVHHI